MCEWCAACKSDGRSVVRVTMVRCKKKRSQHLLIDVGEAMGAQKRGGSAAETLRAGVGVLGGRQKKRSVLDGDRTRASGDTTALT